jgi:hypothetical protein
MNTDWLKSPANLVMIGPTGAGNYAKQLVM